MNRYEYGTSMYGGLYSIYTCPECGIGELIDSDGKYRCLSCGITYIQGEIEDCTCCGEPFRKNKKDLEMCPSCRERYIRRIEKY